MPVSKDILDGLPILDSNESTDDGLPVLKKKDGTKPSSTSSTGSASSESESTTPTGNPFEFTLDRAKSASSQPALPDPKNILLRAPVPQNGELGPLVNPQWEYTGPTKGKVIQATIADPVYKTLTATEKKSLINTKLIENGLTTPERVAQEQAAELQKSRTIDELASQDTGIKISDYENAGKKTVYYDGRNYDNTKIYHLNDTDYAILNDGRKVKYQGNQWVSVNNQESDQLEGVTATTQKEFFDVPQNITKNLFVGTDEQQYVQAANKYLYNLKENDPVLYDDISRQLLGKRGHDFFTAEDKRIDINQKDLEIQKLKKQIIENSQIANVNSALEDLNVIANRVGPEKIQKYRELSAIPDGLGIPIINNTFSPGEIEDIQKVIDYSGQIKAAKDNINFANQNLVKDAYQQEVKQAVYDATAAIDQTGLYSGMDAIKTVWNTTIGAANGTMGLIKKLDRDNKYGAIDLWTDSFNEASKNLQMTTAQREMFGEGGFDPKAVLPAVAQGITSMYLFGRGGNILSEAGLGYNAGIVASSFAMQHNDYYQQARGKMTDLQANDFSTFATGLTSMLELVSPGEAIWGKQGIMHLTLDEAMTKFAKGESFESILKPILKEVGKEDIQEVSQDLGDILAKGAANTVLGKDTLDTEYNLNQFLETVTTTTLATALSGGFSGINVKGQDRRDIVNRLSSNDGIMNVALSTIEQNAAAGLITEDKANSLTEELITRNAELKALPPEWNDIKKGRIIDLQNELSTYEQKQFTVDEKGQLVEQPLSQTDQKAIVDLNKKIVNLSALPNEHFDNELRTQEERAAQILKGNPTPVASALSGVGETKTPQEAADEIESLKEAATQLTEEKDFTVGEMINTPVVYNGQNGSIYQDGQTLVFKVNGQEKEFELGNVDEIKDRPLSDFGIAHEQSVVSFGDNGEIKIREKTFVNNFSDPIAAINRDPEGNIISVNLETEDGKKRTFRGNVAEDIAYQLHLQKISQDEAAQEEFITHINQDEKAKELINAGLSEATTVPSTENNAGVPRQKIQPIKSAWEANIEALINPETGLASVMRKALEQQKPYKEAFMKRIGLTMDSYASLPENDKEDIQKQWVESSEFKELESVINQPPIINPQSNLPNESQSKQEGGEEKQSTKEGNSDQGKENAKVVLTPEEGAGVDKKAPAKPSNIEDGKKRRAAIEEIETSEKEFIDSISPDHSRYLAGLLLDGYTKDEIELTKKVRDAFKEIDGTDNFGKIFKTLRENNFDVEAVIGKIDPNQYDQATVEKLTQTLRGIGEVPVKPLKEKNPIYIDGILNQDPNIKVIVNDLISQKKKITKENLIASIDSEISQLEADINNEEFTQDDVDLFQRGVDELNAIKNIIQNSQSITLKPNATTKRKVEKSDQPEYTDGDQIGQESETGDSNSPEQSGEIQEEEINSFDYSIDNIMPDESVSGSIKKYIELAQNINESVFLSISIKVREALTGTQFTESDYLSSIGNVYEKLISQKNQLTNEELIATNPEERRDVESRLSPEDNIEQEPVIEAIEGEAEVADVINNEEAESAIDQAVDLINRATDAFKKPLSEITTNEKKYQGRVGVKYAEESVRSMLSEFGKKPFDAIYIDPDNVVLSGHSRRFAFIILNKIAEGKTLTEEEQNLLPEGMSPDQVLQNAIDGGFKADGTIDVRVKNGTEAALKEFAILSNTAATQESPASAANRYRNMRLDGMAHSKVLQVAKGADKQNGKGYVDLSYLNPDGLAIQAIIALDKGEGDSRDIVLKIAKKVGAIREFNPHLTDFHENELFKYFQEQKEVPTDIEIRDQNSGLNRSINAVKFDNTQPLNLSKRIDKSPARMEWEKEKAELEADIKELRILVNPDKVTGWNGLKNRAIASLSKGKTKDDIDKAQRDFSDNVNGIKDRYEELLETKKQELRATSDKLAKHLLQEANLIQGEKDQISLFEPGYTYRALNNNVSEPGLLEKELDRKLEVLKKEATSLQNKYDAEKKALSKRAADVSATDLFGGKQDAKLFDDRVSLNEAESVARQKLDEIKGELNKKLNEIERLEGTRRSVEQADQSQLSLFNEGKPKNDASQLSLFYTSKVQGDYPNDAVTDQDESQAFQTTVRAIWREDGGVTFDGSATVQNHADVAEIMKNLESKPVEHFFAVYVDADGKSHIHHVAMGGTSSTVVDAKIIMAGVVRFNAKKVYMVHNHPSGSLQPSGADIQLTNRIGEALKEIGVEMQHVIMNADQGKYVLLEKGGGFEIQDRAKSNNMTNEILPVHLFDMVEVLSKPISSTVVKESKEVATIIQQFKFSAMPKRAILLLNRANKVIGNVKLEDYSARSIIEAVSPIPTATSIIIYGNVDETTQINYKKEALKHAGIDILDVMVFNTSNDVKNIYRSMGDEGLLWEVQQKYGTNSVNEPLSLEELRRKREEARARIGLKNEDNAGEGNNPPPGDEESTGEPGNKPPAGITHAAIQALTDEFDVEGYEKEVVHDKDLSDKADALIAKGYNFEKLLNKANTGDSITPLEAMLLGKYKEALAEKLRVDPSNEVLAKLRQFSQIAGLIGGSDPARVLRLRQFTQVSPESLEGYFLRKMDVNRTDILTDAQKAEVTKQFNEIKAANEALEKKLKDLQDKEISKQAQKEVTRSRAPKSKVTKSSEDFTKERADILKNIRDKWNQAGKGDNMITSVLIPLPFKKIKQLVAVAPDVKDLMKSLVQEGVIKLDQIIDNIHSLLKNDIEDLNKSDIRDIIAGVYNEPQRTRTEIAVQLEDLRTEAKLLKQLADLENGIIPTEEKKIRRRNQAITDLRQQISDLKRRLGASNTSAPERDKLDTIKGNLKRRITKLENDLKTGNYTSEKKKEPIELDQEAIDLKDKLIKLQNEREKKLLQEEYANRTKLEKTKDLALEILNVPRTVMSSIDFSAPLRQGLIPTISHPTIAGPALVEMFRQAVSQKRFDRWFYDLRNTEAFKIMDQSGLYVADPHDIRLSAKEEYFMNNLAEKIPLIGQTLRFKVGGVNVKIPGLNLIKGSERAYVSYLNKMRVDLFKQGAELLKDNGKTFTNNPDAYKALAKMVNALTGRGDLGVLETSAPVLNTLFFSPRLIASRVNLLTQFLNPNFYTKLPKEVRNMYMKDMAKTIGFGLSVLGLMKFGWECPDKKSKDCITVEDDPRSTDFGKIKSGNTRYDIWGGFQQYIRFITQMLTGEKIKPKTGKVQSLNGKGAFGTDRSDVVAAFLRGKLAPIASVIVDAMKGRTPTGEKVTLTGEMESKLLPLLYSDLKDALKEDGIKALFTVGLPAAFGVGVQTFDEKKSPSKK